MPSLMLRDLPPDLIQGLREYGLAQSPTISPTTAAIKLLREGLARAKNAQS